MGTRYAFLNDTQYNKLFKNRIINGDFAIWQRGTSASYSSDADALTIDQGYKSADRIWASNVRAGGKFTVSRGSLNGLPSYKVVVDTPPENLSWDGSNTRCWDPFTYHFEGSHLYDIAIKKGSVTISFLWRSNVTGKISISLHNQTSIPDESKYENYVTSFVSNGNDEVQRVTVTIPLDHNWLQPPRNDNNRGFVLNIGLIGDSNRCDPGQENQWVGKNSSGIDPYCVSDYTNWAAQAGNYIEIAQLQLEEGEVATEFEYVPYEIQLMRCMRYCEVLRDEGSDTPIGNGKWYSGDCGWVTYFFKVPKRVPPSMSYGPDLNRLVVEYSGGPVYIDSLVGVSSTYSYRFQFHATTTSTRTNFATLFGFCREVAQDGYIIFDAEL